MRKSLISSLILVITLSVFSIPVCAGETTSGDMVVAATDGLTPDDAQQMTTEADTVVPGE